nr:hypothetical protein CFP56_78428 [Quercus suber]
MIYYQIVHLALIDITFFLFFCVESSTTFKCSRIAMVTPSNGPRERYLRDACRLLVDAAPVVAAYMQTTNRQVSCGQDNVAETPTMEKVCSACGNRLLLGWSCTPASGKESARTRKDRISKSGIIMKVACSRCDTISTISSGKPSSRLRNPAESTATARSLTMTSKSMEVQQPKVEVIAEQPTPSVSTAAKRRVRNKKSSLQSILASQAITANNAPRATGFDIMDFMKS